MGAADERHTVPAVNRAMELLRVLAGEDVDRTTAGLAERLAIPRTTCYRILRSLAARDWIRAVNGGHYEISLGLFPVLQPLRPYEQLLDAIQPGLEALARRTRLTAKVSVRQGDYAVTIARGESPTETSVAVRVGAAFHLAFGSSGAVLLSALPTEAVSQILKRAPAGCWRYQKRCDVMQRIEDFRARRYCCDLGTYQPTCHAVSAALRGADRRILAAVTVIGFPQDIPSARVSALVRTLGRVTQEMSAAAARCSLPFVKDRKDGNL